MISGFYWYTSGGQILDAHQDKKGALAISPTIVILPAGKHGISHNILGTLEPCSGDHLRIKSHCFSGPGAARTILLFHTICARPPKQPRMVRTFLKVHTRPRLAYALRCRGGGVRSGQEVARTILLFHTICARPPKQTRMVRTFLKVHTRPRLSYALRCRGY